MYFFFSFRYDRTFAKRYIRDITVLHFDMIDFCVRNTNSFLLVFIFSKSQYGTVLQKFSFRFIILQYVLIVVMIIVVEVVRY